MSRVIKTAVATMELVLIVPALVFFAAIFFRNFFPTADNGAQQIVGWYAGRHWTLWTLLIGLPLTVLILGAATVLNSWNNDASLREDASRALAAVRAHLGIIVIGSATAAAGILLAFVALHMLLN